MEIKWLNGTENLSDSYYVRREVFIKEQCIDESLEWDEMDAQGEHIVIYIDGKPVATGRLIVVDGQYMLGRIAVLKEYRGRNLGRVLVENLMKRAFEKGAREIYIHAQTQVRKFYEKLGFEAYGDTYEEAGIEHISMKVVAR
jgi:Acetyltransferase (GNAT) family.